MAQHLIPEQAPPTATYCKPLAQLQVIACTPLVGAHQISPLECGFLQVHGVEVQQRSHSTADTTHSLLVCTLCLQQTQLNLMVWKMDLIPAYERGKTHFLSKNTMVQEPEGYGIAAHRADDPKRQRASKTAADSKPSKGSGSLDSDAQLSSEAECLTQAGAAPTSAQLEDPTQEEHNIQSTQPRSDSTAVKEHAVDVQQHSSMRQQQQQCMANAVGVAAGLQQSAAEGELGPGLLHAQRKDPLCLRVRPLDSPTKRLMQSLGCTVLLEMPNNK